MEPKLDLADIDISSEDTITLSSNFPWSNTTVGGGGYTVSNIPNASITATSYPYTISTGTGITSPWGATNLSPKIKLDGQGADIEVNGWSLVDAVRRIEERLDLFQPNPELEKEWEELRALGEQYRQLEQHIRDKQATWDRLKAMPAPTVD